jgi:GNAT superfamily N-acetyltransferase
VDVDYVDSMALVAQQDERIVGVTHCFRYENGYHADVSVAVEDACQGQGIGPTLLEHLTHLARDRGITVFDADVLAENRRILRILAQTGLPMSRVLHMGVVHVEISLTSRTSSGGPLG